MNKVCALVILYNGREMEADDAALIAKQLEALGIIADSHKDLTLVYKDADAIAKAIIAQEEHRVKQPGSTIKFVIPEGKKLQTVKFLKEEFDLGLARAKEVADAGYIVVENPNYDSILKGFCKIGVHAVDLTEDVALQQAVIYINERYPKAHLDKTFLSTLIRDVLDAKDRNDNISIALIEAIRLIANASHRECDAFGLYESVYNAVCKTYNLLSSM